METKDFGELPEFDDEALEEEALAADSENYDYSEVLNTPVEVPEAHASLSETAPSSDVEKDPAALRALIAEVVLEIITEKEKKEKKPRVYPNLGRFVSEQIAQVVTREVDNREICWCSEWWKHPEALQRLEALWHSWENTRASKSSSMLDWWRDFDYHFAQLTSSAGVFKMCRDGKHSSRMNADHQLKVGNPGDAFFEALLGDTNAV